MQRDYNFRAHHRGRMIQRRFEFYYYTCNDRDDWSDWRWRERVFLESNKARYRRQRENASRILLWAKKSADNRKLCSCYMCGGYHEFEPSFQRTRIDARMADEEAEWRGSFPLPRIRLHSP